MQCDAEMHSSSEIANHAIAELLPDKSKELYQKSYKQFINWCDSNSVNNYSESVLLTHFSEMSKVYKPSTLWSYYSKIKSTLLINKKVDISKYSKLISLLKNKSDGYIGKKSKVLSREQIMKFVKEAPDDIYLVVKIAALLGIAGALRCQEMLQLSIDDIDDRGTSLFITVRDTKEDRSFYVIDDKETLSNFFPLYRRYVSLRPPHCNHRRFFIFYNKGKCSAQVIGKNTLGKMTASMARYLKLPNPEMYTGHCLRKTSVTLLADSGADIPTVKRLGGWKSRSVARGYVQNSNKNKITLPKPENGNQNKDFNNVQDVQQLPKDNKIQNTERQSHRTADQELNQKFKDSNIGYSELQRSTDEGTTCTATDLLSFAVPTTKITENVTVDTEDLCVGVSVQDKYDELFETSIKTEVTEYNEDKELFPMEDVNQHVMKTESIEIVEEELPIEHKLNPTELREYMEEILPENCIHIKKAPILSHFNETRHFEDSAAQTTFTWVDNKALQAEIKTLKNENRNLKLHILKQYENLKK